MSDHQFSPLTDSPDSTTSENPRPGLIGLGKRIASRTTDLVAVGILLIAGLSMGGSVIRWWNSDPEDLTRQATQGVVDRLLPPDWEAGFPVGIAVGNSSVGMERSELAGPRAEIEQALIEQVTARSIAAATPDSPPDPRETRLVTSLAGQTPHRMTPAGVRVYLTDGPLVWCVGVKPVPTDHPTQNEADVSPPRVVCWGIAFPSGFELNRWSVWLMWPGGDQQTLPESDWRGVLPDSSACSLALSSPRGHILLAFSGTGSRESWANQVESRFRERGFVLENNWHSGPNGLSGRFVARHADAERIAFVQAGEAVGGTFRGLIQISAEDQKDHAP
jgi:hypothetical protein